LSNKALFAAVCLVVTGAACASPIQGQLCTERDAVAADAIVDHLDSWAQVDAAFRKYGHCDDGGIAEGMSEAIARLLTDRWKTLPELGAQIKRNPPLESFVLRHIDSTLDSDDLAKIATLSTRSCPAGMRSLCKALAHAASQAEQ
jgi:hypothetical protein